MYKNVFAKNRVPSLPIKEIENCTTFANVFSAHLFITYYTDVIIIAIVAHFSQQIYCVDMYNFTSPNCHLDHKVPNISS